MDSKLPTEDNKTVKKASAATGTDRSFIYAAPLVPSVVCVVMSASATMVLEVAKYGDCSDSNGESLQAYVVGAIILGYVFSLYHGFTMVGPSWGASGMSLLVYLTHAAAVMAWCIYGCVAVAVVTKDCMKTSLWHMSIALIVIQFAVATVSGVTTLRALCCTSKAKK